MDDWEKELREKLDSELTDKLYEIKAGDYVMFTGKAGKIDLEVEVEKTLREKIKNVGK